MSPRDDGVYLRHILDSIAKITTYLQGLDEAAFLQQSLVHDAVIRQLEIIGEAVKHLSPALRKRHPAIPWKDMAGMRDKLIHSYFNVDLEAVWETVTQDVPVLREQLEQILHGME